MNSKLTMKQEQFCQEYIATGNASEAYRRAYKASAMKPETIAVKACELLRSGKVTVRVDELKADLQQSFGVTVTDKMNMLWRIANDCLDLDDKGKLQNPSAAVSAIKELNLMVGDNAPSKTEISGDIQVRNLIQEISNKNAQNRVVLPKLANKED